MTNNGVNSEIWQRISLVRIHDRGRSMQCARCGQILKVEGNRVYPCENCLEDYLTYRLTGLPNVKEFFSYKRT